MKYLLYLNVVKPETGIREMNNKKESKIANFAGQDFIQHKL